MTVRRTATRPFNDTYVTLAARNGMYLAILLGSVLLVGLAASQAVDVERQMAVEARV
jgi:hypothetical protein